MHPSEGADWACGGSSILEESGWKLRQEGEESSDDEEAFELPTLGSYN